METDVCKVIIILTTFSINNLISSDLKLDNNSLCFGIVTLINFTSIQMFYHKRFIKSQLSFQDFVMVSTGITIDEIRNVNKTLHFPFF